MMNIESLSDEELDAIEKRYEKIRKECVARHERNSKKN